MDPALRELAAHYGVATDFTDWRGQWTETPESTVITVLAAMGVDGSNPQAAAAALGAAHTEQWRAVLPSCVVTRSNTTRTVDVHVPDGATTVVWAELADGRRVDAQQWENWEPAREIDGRMIAEATFQVPLGLPLGYHRLVAEVAGERHSCLLAITPDWLGMPERLGDDPCWGVTAQLYSVRSRDSWGMGDLADLDMLCVGAAQQGADFVLVNPMHADAPAPPLEPSPYLPTTRRFINPLYLRVAAIEEFAELDQATRSEIDALAEQAIAACSGRIDRHRVWAAKDAALRAVFAVERSSERQGAFNAYRVREGEGLRNFATWCALAVEFGNNWHDWAEQYQDAGSPAVAEYSAQHRDEVEYHEWLQWVVDEQMLVTQRHARAAGMSLGVVHDLAVGVSSTGAEAWSLRGVFAEGVCVGAPPDAFTHLGQDWGQPPWRPDALARAEYEPFRAMVRGLLRHSGGLRVDHILGLFRLWWVPWGATPKDGTYVYYDHEALVGLLALEAWLAGAVVIGEDLGTVEPWVRTYLAERGLLGTSILWWERHHNEDGRPLEPSEWREYCLASATTHDLPPTAGYLEQSHVHLRHSLGLIGEDLETELANDAAEVRDWTNKLVDLGLLSSVDAPTRKIVEALHRYLERTPARMRGAALVDMVGDRQTQNQPGTVDEYPNWRVPLAGPDQVPVMLEDVLADERFAALAAVLNGSRT